MIGLLFCASNMFDAPFHEEDDDLFEMSHIYEETPTITYSGDSFNTSMKSPKGSPKGSVKGSESPSARKNQTSNNKGPSRSNINVKGYISVRSENNKKKYVDRLTGKNFALTPDLENGAVSLAPEESIIASWHTISTKMRIIDYFWSILTFGVYYIATQWYSYRQRSYSLLVTNQRVIIKEEIFSSVGIFCNTQQTHENQVSYHLSSLAYLCTEHVGSRYCGLYPPKVTLELHFIQSPSWFNRPDNSYHPNKGILTWPYCQAYHIAYGVDVMSTALQQAQDRIMQINAFTSLTTYQYFIRTLLFALVLFPVYCVVGSLFYMASCTCQSAAKGQGGAYLTQTNSPSDRRQFRFEMDMFTDLDCIEHLGLVIKALTDQLSPQAVTESTTPTRHIKSREGLDTHSSGNLEPLHKETVSYIPQKKSSKAKETGLVYYTDILPLGHNESLLDGYPDSDNPSQTKQTACYYFTSNRLIRQELWLSQHDGGGGSELQYARGETWFLFDKCSHNMLAVNYQNTHKHLFIACNHSSEKKYGLEVMMSSLECALHLWHVLTTMKEKRRDSLAHIPSSELDQYEEFKHARLTRGLAAVDKGEWIESTLQTTHPSSGCCCCCSSQSTVLTATNAGLYLEKILSDCSIMRTHSNRQQRILIYRAWDTLQSSYWSNYQLTYCFGSCPAPSKQWVYPYGYSGSRLMIEGTDQDQYFSFGVELPGVYYAAENRQFNALVDTVNMRCYADGELGGGVSRGFALVV